jgi:2-polyprenyl-3-methyl-5-hydroxy-6-metoxy-1,4-benzoquinol methylase
MKQSIIKPNLLLKQEANKAYADHYKTFHRKFKNTSSYPINFLYLLILDKIFLKKYNLLDVGCGSGIFYRLLNNYKSILGLDFSKTMIELAEKKNSKRNIRFENTYYEKFHSNSKYDAISLVGVYGHYISWLNSFDVIKKSHELLNKNGILIISYSPPTNLFELLKTILFPNKTKCIKKDKIVKIFSNYRFLPIFFSSGNNMSWIFFKKK